jgi:phosphoribosyl-ATP pyrophosphohydrolase
MTKESEQSEKNKVEHEEQMKIANKVMEEDKEVLKRYEEGTARIADPRYREDRSY